MAKPITSQEANLNKELIAACQNVVNAFRWHENRKHGKSMAQLREAVAALEGMLRGF